jgi:hypothetical protein
MTNSTLAKLADQFDTNTLVQIRDHAVKAWPKLMDIGDMKAFDDKAAMKFAMLADAITAILKFQTLTNRN